MAIAKPQLTPSVRLDVAPRPRRLAYLSGAPRVSTRPDAETGGPRSHILGVTGAFQELGWDLRTFIVGDQVPAQMTRKSEYLMLGKLGALGADLTRMAARYINERRAWHEIGGSVDWVYERFASFQRLGHRFHEHGTTWIVESNGLFYKEAKSDRGSMMLSDLARRCELSAYRDCDVLVCVSRTLKEMLCSDADIDPAKILVVPNGVDSSFFNPGKCLPERHFESFTIGFVGRLSAWQAVDVLLRAIASVRERLNFDINLVVAGDGSMRQAWRSLAEELGIAKNVAFLGQVSVDRVPGIIAGCDIGFSGQIDLKSGGMYHSPLKIYEYMAMGKPVLASAYDDSRRVVLPSQTGFLFTAGNVDELKDAIVTSYKSRAALPAMGAVARELVIAQHSWGARVREMIAGIDHIVEKKK